MNKTALVTGAFSGIGKAPAKLLAAQGSIAYAAAGRSEKIQDLEKDADQILGAA